MPQRHHKGKSQIQNARRILEICIANSGEDPLDLVISALDKLAKEHQLTNDLFEVACPATPNKFQTLNTKAKEEIESLLKDNIDFKNISGEFLHTLFEVLSAESSKSDKGQYFTPMEVAELCAGLVDYKSNISICDPACGSGMFLEKVWKNLREMNVQGSLYGFDISERSLKVSRCLNHLIMNDSCEYRRTDSLDVLKKFTNGTEIELETNKGKFDVIITNPPFAGDAKYSYAELNYRVEKELGLTEKDCLFLELCIDLLNEDGQLIIILPENKISGKKFSKLRSFLLDLIIVDSVISLHPYTFRPFTHQKTSILVARKSKSQGKNVFFIKSENPGKTSNGSKSKSRSDYKEILSAYKTRAIHERN